jgi:acetyl-CoA C-acetyltransferase
MAERCAVVGIGQTKHDTMRIDVSLPGLLREAVGRAFEDAGVTWRDIDAVVIGKAPDMFEGTMMPELYLADALGAAGKPILRVHTAGSVGGSTALIAASLIEAGVRSGRVLRAARPCLHRPLARTGGHRNPRRPQRPVERAQESLLAPGSARHQLRHGA